MSERRPIPVVSAKRQTRRRRGVLGAVMVEYAFLLVAVGIPTLAGLMFGGQRVYQGYVIGRDAMLSPFP